MRRLFEYILFVVLFTLPIGRDGVGCLCAQNKPKTLKELVAEEKARKEAEKAAKAAEEKASSRPSPEGKGERSTATTPEEAADIVTETDSAIWAPTRVK